MKTKNLLKKAFLLLALMGGATSAWGDVTYYTPEADEVIILNNVYKSDATGAGYSSHTAIQWGGTASTSNKKAGDPNNGGAATSSNVACYSVKGNGGGKNITINITGVSKIIVYHESHASRYVELRSESKSGTVIGSGSASTYYTEVNLTGTTNYSLFLHGTTGSDDQDIYVYAVKLFKYGSSKTPSDLTITSGTTLLLEKNATSTITHTTSSTGAITYLSADDDVATVTSGGVITAQGGGKTKITVAQASDETYAAGSKVVDVNVPYDNPAAADTYTLTSPELSFSNAAKTKHYFTNGFTVTTNAEDGMQYAGIESNTGIKYSHVRTYTINTPSNVTATYLEIKARSNYTAEYVAANWGTVLGTDYSDEALPFSDEEPQTKYFQIASPAAGADLSFSPGGNQWQGYITVHTNAWVAATGVELNKTSTSIGVGNTETLTPTFTPTNASNRNIAWTSSNTSVATVANGVVTAVAEGSATITATTEDGSFTATCDVTVVLPIVTLPTGTRTGYSQTGTTGTYSRTNHPYDGQTLITIPNGGYITLKVPVTTQVSMIKVSGSSDDGNSSTITITGANAETSGAVSFVNRDARTVSTAVFTPTTQTTTYTIASGSKKSVVKIAIYGTENVATISAYGYATFSSISPVDFTGVEGLKAYKATECDGSTVRMEEVTGAVAANTGLVLKGAAGTYNIPVAEYGTSPEGNLLFAINGSYETVGAGTGGTNYVLSVQSGNVVWAAIDGVAAPVKAGQAALFVPDSNNARSLRMVFPGDEITGVANVEAAAEAVQKEGKFVENGKLVIYKNGKKFNAAGAQVK